MGVKTVTKVDKMANQKTKFRPPPKREADIRQIDKIYLHSTMFDLGIVPIESPEVNIEKCLNTLPTEDAVKMKRKFRKLWRKAYKKNHLRFPEHYKYNLDMGKKIVSRSARYLRKKIVLDYVWDEQIAEKIFNAENLIDVKK